MTHNPTIYVSLTLPWPSSELSPNSRDRWGRIKSVKSAREIAAYAMMEMGLGPVPCVAPLEIRYYFYPPNKRHFDLDGLVSRCKAYQDAIFDCLGLDDNLIVTLDARRCAVRKDGEVEITITEAQDV